jgi:fucose permease
MKQQADRRLKLPSSRPPRRSVLIAFCAFLLIGAYDGSIGVLLPSMRAFYYVNNATIALLFLTSTAGYLLSSFNTGLLIEKIGMRRFLLLGVTIFMIGAAVVSLSPPFIIFLLTGLLIGFGEAVLDAGLNAYIAGLPSNTILLNNLHAFYGGGALSGPLIASGFLALHWAWNSVYLVWVAVSLCLLLGFGLTFKRSASSVGSVGERTENVNEKQGNILIQVLRLRVVWLAAFFLLFYVGTETSLGSWSYSFLIEQRHGSILFSGWIISGYWMGLTLGRLTLARLMQRFGRKHLVQMCLAGVLAGMLLVWFAPGAWISAIGLCFTGFCLGPIFPTTIALMATLVPERLLPGAVGFLASLGSMGAALFPWLAGNLAQYVGLQTLPPYAIALTAIMVIFWFGLAVHREMG